MVLSYTPIFLYFEINLHYLNIRKFSLSAKKREKKLKKVEFFLFVARIGRAGVRQFRSESVGMERKRNPGKPGF